MAVYCLSRGYRTKPLKNSHKLKNVLNVAPVYTFRKEIPAHFLEKWRWRASCWEAEALPALHFQCACSSSCSHLFMAVLLEICRYFWHMLYANNKNSSNSGKRNLHKMFNSVTLIRKARAYFLDVGHLFHTKDDFADTSPQYSPCAHASHKQ